MDGDLGGDRWEGDDFGGHGGGHGSEPGDSGVGSRIIIPPVDQKCTQHGLMLVWAVASSYHSWIRNAFNTA